MKPKGKNKRRERIIITEEEFEKLPLILRTDHSMYCIVAKRELVYK